MDIRAGADIRERGVVEVTAQPAETVATGAHFPFDWNGWGIGIEADPLNPTQNISAWQPGVRTTADGY